MFVVERHGTVRVLDDGMVQRKPFLDIRREVKDSGKGGEQGLLSIAFPPDYTDSGHFYVAYTDKGDALRVVEYSRREGDELRAARKSAREVMRIPQTTTKHHGGLLLFGPDKYLYIGSGDSGPSGDPYDAAQNKRLLLGKILRIDPSRPRPRPAAAPPAKPAQQKAKDAKEAKEAKGAKGAAGEGKASNKRPPKPPRTYTIPKDNPLVG
ncbi:MAG: PQQ-dependent sugar dehydrogenase, partial [Actinomycetota bacterium]|nr:PQQ-dependent sugar dehydrogenase [Actinomycetota bacterium]